MPSDSIAGFLDQAQANRVLFPEQVEQLIRQPDIPQTDLDALCEYLEARGALTRFQAAALRDGRGHELNFAGYPVLDELGPCPGGTAYRALHPSLRTPVVLRRFRADDLFPTDTVAALLQRTQAAAALHHPYLVTVLDAGTPENQPFAALDLPADFPTLDALLRDIGPMPGFLAAEYGRQAAAALRAAHERGLWHGDVRPANLLVGPMTTKPGPDGTVKRRPAPNAAVRLAELGLVPVRPAASVSPPPADALPYLPPERIDGGEPTPRGDLYGLGATLYYLLAGRPPFAGASPTDVMEKIKAGEPAPLTALRPDIPVPFAAVVHQLLAKRPEDRPATAFDVEQALVPFCRPGAAPAAPPSGSSGPVPVAIPYTGPEGAPAGEAHPSSAGEWGAGEAFSLSHSDHEPPAPRPMSAKDKARTRLLVALGLCLHLSAVALLVAWLAGAFDSPEPEPTPAPTKKEPAKPPKKPRKQS
jgi:serine/threonine protein kinase